MLDLLKRVEKSFSGKYIEERMLEEAKRFYIENKTIDENMKENDMYSSETRVVDIKESQKLDSILYYPEIENGNIIPAAVLKYKPDFKPIYGKVNVKNKTGELYDMLKNAEDIATLYLYTNDVNMLSYVTELIDIDCSFEYLDVDDVSYDATDISIDGESLIK